ncbi:MAG: BatA domain-containing protein [Gemmataceae bacterium]|nr:BatA domain-containing protein [Gemmataceae bacterium]
MEALFTHPLTMLAGAGLVSVPVIIHLINRMRFRRVKWAAMEFLLKAQKRMRRKLILEQLLLLLLRCLLVFLVGVLLARFKGFGTLEGEDARATAHVVVLDDSPSTADAFAADGKPSSPFEQAKTQVTDRIAAAAAQANTPQSMDVLLLSDLANPRPVERLKESAIEDLRAFLRPLAPSAVRVSLVDGLRRAKEVLDQKPDAEVAKVVHIVADLRAADWTEDGETLKQLLTEMTAAGVRVHLIDTAHPNRRDGDRQPRSSDNAGIVEFRPRARTAARFQPVDFELRVKNWGSTELKDTKVQFFLNGKGNLIQTASIPRLQPQEEQTLLITVPQLERLGTKENPLLRYNLITAMLAAEPGGLAADNVRHAVVELKERLSVLVIEGRPDQRNAQKADGFFLRRLFQDAFGGINWVDGAEADLEKKDLREFAAIYLINVPALTQPQAEKLEAFVRSGGGVGVFLGPNVRPADYNKVLYRGGEGAFPVPLPDAFTKAPNDEQKLKRALVLAKRVLTRDAAAKAHPALVGMYTGTGGAAVKDVEIERYFMFANIDQYWPVRRFGRWRDDASVRELFCLPNEQPMAEFQGPARDLLDKLKTKAAEPKFEKYRQYLDPLDRRVRETTAGSDPLAVLAALYDRLLCDQINDGDPSEPVLREFWGQPELADLKPEFQRERDRVKFGDPLYLVKDFGRGRVAVMTTDAGGGHADGPWTDWPAGAGAPGWLAVVAEMQKYLAGGPAEENRSVGAAVSAAFDPARYKPGVARLLVTADPAKADRAGDLPVDTKPLGDQPLDGAGAFRFAEARVPGVYLMTATQLAGNGPADAEKLETEAYTFNLDAAREGDLRRANGDDLAQYAPNVPVHSPDDATWVSELKQKRDDFSTRRWLYLLILLVLIAEQAMAVRLSFHTRPDDLELRAPSAAATFDRPIADAIPRPAEPAGV